MSLPFTNRPSASLFIQKDHHSDDELVPQKGNLQEREQGLDGLRKRTDVTVETRENTLSAGVFRNQVDSSCGNSIAEIGHEGMESQRQNFESRPGSESRPLHIQAPNDSQMEEVHIDAHLLFSLVDVSQNDAWAYLNLNFNVTQNFLKDPSDNAHPPNNTAQTTQKLLKEYGHGGKHIREATVTISIRSSQETKNRRYQFQLFCVISEDPAVRENVGVDWTQLEVCAFVMIRGAKRPLEPINRTISRAQVVSCGGEMSLGSFSYDGHALFHITPSYLQTREKNRTDFSMPTTSFSTPISNNIIILNNSEIQREPKKARAGRPRSKRSLQLLVTREQAEKTLEMRERWAGMGRRQRKFHIVDSDLYPFLTISRDECANLLLVCHTWFKEVIRSQGIKVWPGRPLRRTGAELEILKTQLETARATVQYSCKGTDARARGMHLISSLQEAIKQKLAYRLEIIENQVTSEYLQRFVQGDGQKHLYPEWVALPPPIPRRH